MLFFCLATNVGRHLRWYCKLARSRYDCARYFFTKNKQIYKLVSLKDLWQYFVVDRVKKTYTHTNWFAFINKLCVLSSQGNALISAFKILKNDIQMPQNFITHGIERMENGNFIYPLWYEIKNPIPDNCRKILESAEIGGYLFEGIKSVKDFLVLQKNIKEQLRRCFIYPVCVLSVTIFFLCLLNLFLVPQIEVFCQQQDLVLNGATKVLFGFNHHFGAFLITLLGTLFLTVFVFKLKKFSPVQYIMEHGCGALRYSLFARNFSALLRNHVTLIDCVKLSLPILKNKFSFDKIVMRLNNGGCLSEALRELPYEFYDALQNAEFSGNYSQAFEQLAIMYYQRYESWVQRWIKWAEPLSIILVSLFIFVMLLTLFYPLLQIFQGMNFSM